MAANLPATRLVYVADREADLMPLMLRAQELGTPTDWLVRAAHNRCLPDGEQLWQYTSANEPVGEISFAMAARRQGTYCAPATVGAAGNGKTVSATCPIVREVDAPSAPS